MIDHWEALFDRNYLRWFHLDGEPALVEITGLEREKELTLPGGTKETKPVLHLKQVKGKIEDIKPLVLNHTNGQSIAVICGSEPSKWAGNKIVLYPDKTKVVDKQTRKLVIKDCIRVRAPK